ARAVFCFALDLATSFFCLAFCITAAAFLASRLFLTSEIFFWTLPLVFLIAPDAPEQFDSDFDEEPFLSFPFRLFEVFRPAARSSSAWERRTPHFIPLTPLWVRVSQST